MRLGKIIDQLDSGFLVELRLNLLQDLLALPLLLLNAFHHQVNVLDVIRQNRIDPANQLLLLLVNQRPQLGKMLGYLPLYSLVVDERLVSNLIHQRFILVDLYILLIDFIYYFF